MMLNLPEDTDRELSIISHKVDTLVDRLSALSGEERTKNYPALRLAVDLQNTIRSHIDYPPT